MARALGMKRPTGIIVENILPGGPADDAGLQSGDVITAVDGHDAEDPQALRFRLATRQIGEKAELIVIRKGRERSIRIALIAPPEDPPRKITMLDGSHPLSGARIANLSPALAEELDLQSSARGVMVLEVAGRSNAARLGIKPGDILVDINGRKIELVRDAIRAVKAKPKEWKIAINRGGRILKVVVQ